jgi:hypothetical protein
MCCVYDGLEPYNHYEPQQDTNNPNPTTVLHKDVLSGSIPRPISTKIRLYGQWS